MSQEYWDFLIPNYRENQIGGLEAGEYCFQEGDHGYRVLYLKAEGRGSLSFYEYGYHSIPNCYAPLDMDAVNTAGISAVQNFPTLMTMGEGIMIGFVDTGIDYTNPVFRTLDGRTRIAGIWDQTLGNGTPPQGFDYGSAFSEEQINEALREEDPLELVPSTDVEGHGTFLASVACGSADPVHRFVGAAPESKIAVVKLKPAKDYLKAFYAIRPDALCYQENDIILGLAYLNRLAEQEQMPLVICLAMGTNFGGHNGSTLLSALLDTYAYTMDRVVVIGGGNEAANRHHFHHRFLENQESVAAEIRVGEGVAGFSAEIWARLPDVVTVALISPSGERTSPISLRQGQKYNLFFTFDGTEVTLEYRLLLENNDSQLIFLRFTEPAEGVWKLELLSVQRAVGDVHIWLPVQESGFPADPTLTLAYMVPGGLEPFEADGLLSEGKPLSFGSLSLRPIHTPGHMIGSHCFLIDDILVAGDTLFCGSVGRTDHPTGNTAMIMQSVRRLAALPGDYRVFPGHGPETTLERERRFNPYLQ